MTWTVARGDMIEIIADDMDDRKADVQSVVAHLRPGIRATKQPDPLAAAAAVFAVSDRVAVGPDDKGGWWLRITPAICNSLAPGFYMVDFRMIFGPNDERTTRPVPIEITEPATVHANA